MKKRFDFKLGVSAKNTRNQQSNNNDSPSIKSLYVYKRLIKRFLIGCLLVSIGILLADSGGSWDITNHLLNKPETFFSSPHLVLYSGIILALVGAIIMFLYWRSYSVYIYSGKTEKNYETNLFIRLVIISIFMLLSAGPIDFSWHSAFGLDGLLSPPHLILTIGMVAGSIGALIGIMSYININNNIIQQKREKSNIDTFKGNSKLSISIYTPLIIIGILPIWLSSSGLIYMFSLPFSDTEFYNYNLDPTIAAIIATLSFPFLISFILVSLSKLEQIGNKERQFGAISITGSIFIIITISTIIIPNKWLISTIPFYLLNIIPIIIVDIIISKLSSNRVLIYASGAILGSSFFMLYYPLITHIYNEVFSNQLVWPNLTAPIYFEMFPQIYTLVLVPALILGILGTIVSNRMVNTKIGRIT